MQEICLMVTCLAFLAQMVYTAIKFFSLQKNLETLPERGQYMEDEEKTKFYKKECLFPFFKIILVDAILMAVGIVANLIDGVSRISISSTGEVSMDFLNKFLHIAIIFWFILSLSLFAYYFVYVMRYNKIVQYRGKDLGVRGNITRNRAMASLLVVTLMNVATVIAVNFGLILYSGLMLVG